MKVKLARRGCRIRGWPREGGWEGSRERTAGRADLVKIEGDEEEDGPLDEHHY
jgi:hypothetical protein